MDLFSSVLARLHLWKGSIACLQWNCFVLARFTHLLPTICEKGSITRNCFVLARFPTCFRLCVKRGLSWLSLFCSREISPPQCSMCSSCCCCCQTHLFSDQMARLELTPLRPWDDFFPSSERFSRPDVKDLARWNNRVINNLLYYQTNYILMAIVVFLLVG